MPGSPHALPGALDPAYLPHREAFLDIDLPYLPPFSSHTGETRVIGDETLNLLRQELLTLAGSPGTDQRPEPSAVLLKFESSVHILPTISRALMEYLDENKDFPLVEADTIVRYMTVRAEIARQVQRTVDTEQGLYEYYDQSLLPLCDLFVRLRKRGVPIRRWDRARKRSNDSEGVTDYKGWGGTGAENAPMTQQPIWEVKRADRIGLTALNHLYIAGKKAEGVQIKQDQDGQPRVNYPRQNESDQTIAELLLQIIVQFDHNRTGLLLLSTWDGYMVFYRKEPSLIQMSKVIPRTNCTSSANTSLGPDFSDFVDNPNFDFEWNGPLITFGVLVAADHPDMVGYARSSPPDSDDHKVGKKRKSQSQSQGHSRSRGSGTNDGNGNSRRRVAGSGTGGGSRDVAMNIGNQGQTQDHDLQQTSPDADGDTQEHYENLDVTLPGLPDADTSMSSDGSLCPPTTPDSFFFPLNCEISSFGSRLDRLPHFPQVRLSMAFHSSDLAGRTLHDYSTNWSSITWYLDVDNSRGSQSDFIDDFASDIPKVKQTQSGVSPNNSGKLFKSTLTDLRLASYIAHGRLYDVFQATSQSLPGKNLVVKVFRLRTFQTSQHGRIPSSHNHQYEISATYRSTPIYTPSEALAGLKNELALLLGPLARFQGDIVPELIGCWAGQDDTNGDSRHLARELGIGAQDRLMIMSYVGCYAGEWTDLNRTQVINLYNKLHSVGVLHNDVQARHIRRGQDGKLRLIDFEGARYVGAGNQALQWEMHRVESLLQGAR
ncbi:hypothetical protein IAU59_007648 [Kwoniella sp. CBS 9459]